MSDHAVATHPRESEASTTERVRNRCGAIILDLNLEHVVLVMNRVSAKRQEFKWGLPKGQQEVGESCRNAARREVLEETGLDLNFSSSTPCMDLQYDTMYYIYLFDMHSHPVLQPSDTCEISEAVWMPLRELDAMHSGHMNSGLRDMWRHRNLILGIADVRRGMLATPRTARCEATGPSGARGTWRTWE